ncbi:PhoX family protein [Halopiger djelfimassiliensis]|nr:PhoX family protein [Halopiger djelfimassiliensis]
MTTQFAERFGHETTALVDRRPHHPHAITEDDRRGDHNWQ